MSLISSENGIARTIIKVLSDNSGGIHSPSVRRMVGPIVSEDVRTQQLVWNLQSQTPTILRMLYGAHPMTRDEWHDVKAPTLIIAGEEVYPVKNFLLI